MSDKFKKSILIIVLIAVNAVLIIVTSSSVIKAISHVFKTGGVSVADEGEKTTENNEENIIEEDARTNNDTNINEDEVLQDNSEEEINIENITGDTEPTLTVQSKLVNGKATFVIDAEDDENIKTITIIHNGGEQQIINVNEKMYHHEVIMTEGEINTIIVTATNINELTKTRRVKFENK